MANEGQNSRLSLNGDLAIRDSRADNILASRVSLDSDFPIALGGTEDDQWRCSGTWDFSGERSMPDQSSAERSGAEHAGVESRAGGENGGGCETVKGGVRVNILMIAKHERSPSCLHRRMTWSTGDNRASRAIRAELGKS